jgi:iron uptake system component EfeO
MRILGLSFAVLLAACSSPTSVPDGGGDGGTSPSDDQFRAMALQGMHDSLLKDLDALLQAAKDIQAAAPTPMGRGWDPMLDAQAITAMKAAWVRGRDAYEHEEGAIAPLFPDIDYSIDARYDDFMTQLLNQGGDKYLFDGDGVTGMHAIERILFSQDAPAFVAAFESKLPGYVAAAYPSTDVEAADFKNKLCAQLITDVTKLHDQWAPAQIKIEVAYRGLTLLMTEQREKVSKAASTEEESRYAQRTMADMRDNLEGTKAVYTIFQPWLQSKPDGKAIDAKIVAGFDALAKTYSSVQGDAIPQPPATWSTINPSPADLMTPFGQLYTQVRAAVDPNADGSIVFEMNLAGAQFGFVIK